MVELGGLIYFELLGLDATMYRCNIDIDACSVVFIITWCVLICFA